jgi:uncharacterized membrane protein YcaP (DUF421 family)
MNVLVQIFGEGKDLGALQMSARAVAVFFFALIFIRISGRRSFGIRTPLDNIIVVLLGAVLSRAVTGASALGPTICASLALVSVHRLFALLLVRNARVKGFVEGEKILLFRDGKFIKDNLRRGLVSEEDVLQGLREVLQTDNVEGISRIYIERDGEISAIKKSEE